jgi:hypothetical protein
MPQKSFLFKYIMKKIAVLVIFFLILCPAVLAAEKISLRVSPVSFDLTISPDEEKSSQLILENTSDQDLEINVEFSDFFMDENSQYIFPSGEDQVMSEKYGLFSMQNWFRVDKPVFTVKKGQKEIIDVAISVPEKASLGGHYGAVFFRTNCQSEEDKAVISTDKSKVCVSARPGVLFLVQVGGEAVKSGKLKKAEIPGISFSDKENLKIELENTGNTHFKPKGEIIGKNIIGKEIFRTDIKDKTLLPGTSRDFSQILEKKDFLGVYNIIGTIKDGDGKEAKFSRWTFLAPWKEFLAIIALILGSVWFLKRFKIKKRA